MNSLTVKPITPITLIKNKNLDEIKELFKNDAIKTELLNHFKEILNYLINKNGCFDIIKFIINQHYRYHNYHRYKNKKLNRDYEELFFRSMECNNFEIAKLLLKYGSSLEYIDQNNESQNILEYLSKNGKLHQKNLHFILKIKKDASLITNKLLCNLIKNDNFDLFEDVLKYKYYDISFLKSLLLNHNHKTKISSQQFQSLVKSDKQIIKFNEKIEEGDNPILCAIDKYDVKTFQLLLEYAYKNDIVLSLNEKDNFRIYPLLYTIEKNDIGLVKLLINYANKHRIILDINEKDWCQNYPLLWAIYNNSPEHVQLLIDYANKNKMILELNGRDCDGNYPLLLATKRNNIELVKLLINYANKHHIVLELNEKNSNKEFPLLLSIYNDNTEIVRLLMNYANKHHILLELNEEDNYKDYPLLLAIYNNNIEIIKLLVQYGNKNHIILKMDESPFYRINSDDMDEDDDDIDYDINENISLPPDLKDKYGNTAIFPYYILPNCSLPSLNFNDTSDLNEKKLFEKFEILMLIRINNTKENQLFIKFIQRNTKCLAGNKDYHQNQISKNKLKIRKVKSKSYQKKKDNRSRRKQNYYRNQSNRQIYNRQNYR